MEFNTKILLRGFERQCSITIIMNANLWVDVKKSQIWCDHDPQKKDTKVKGIKVLNEGHLYVLDLTVWKKGFGRINKANVKKITTTTSTTSALVSTVINIFLP